MSTIRYYDKQLGKWVVTGASEASDILVTDGEIFDLQKTPNVETVLESHQREINTLKGNVTWLAKYGGGGSGGSGGGAVNVTGSITVNGQSDNSTVLLGPEGLTINVQCSSKKMTFTISVNATVDGRNIFIAKGVNSTSMKITQKMFDDAGVNKSCTLSISAVNGPSLTQFFWNGYVNIASIRLVPLEFESTAYIDRLKSYARFNYFLGSTGIYGAHITINDDRLENFIPNAQYTSLNGTIDISLQDVENALGKVLPGGSSTLSITMFNVDNPTLTASASVLMNLYASDPLIVCEGLSDDSSTPSEITTFDISVTIPVKFKAIYSSGSFKFCICDRNTYDSTVNKKDLKWSPSVYNYNSTVETGSISFTKIEIDSEHEIFINIKDSATDKITTKIFYVKLVKPSVNLLTQPKKSEQIIDLNAFDGSIVDQQWKDSTDKWIAKINNINTYSNHIDVDHRYLRLQNSSYISIDNFKFTPGPTTNFSISTCFKVDYHPDDERTIFQWAVLKADKLPSNGILLRDHDLYIGTDRVLTLSDGEIINLTITFSQEEFGDSGNMFIYIDGVLESVIRTSIKTCLPLGYNGYNLNGEQIVAPNLYIGASEYSNEIFNYTDLNLYRFTFYKECLSPYEVLVDYLNNLATSHAEGTNIDDTYITDGLARNFISVDESGNYQHNLYTAASNPDFEKNYSNNIEDIGNTYFNVDNFIAPPSDYTSASIRDEVKNFSCPIPIVFIDVSNSSNWTWKNFVSPANAGGKLPSVVGKFQYYDQENSSPTSNIMQPISVVVSQQGTSTLADYIKNLDISFDSEEIQDPYVFCPKETWLPETTYTLKADIVDSSHSLNTSIGKFINDEFGIDSIGNNFYPYSDTVKEAFTEFKNSEVGKKYFENATLKHGVEGFPCFTIMRFADGSVKSLGIYQFILGRKSPRNLGYQIIKNVIPKSEYVDLVTELSFPICSNQISIQTSNIEGYWFEFNENNGFTEDIPFQDLDGNLLSKGITKDGKELPAITGAFWQDDPNYYSSVEIKYDNVSTERVGSAYEFGPFRNLISTIQKLPIVFKRQSVRGSGIVRTGTSGSSYPGYKLENNKWVPSTPINLATRGDQIANLFWDGAKEGEPNSYLNLKCFTKYFVIAHLFGLLDNFQKNMPMKFFKKSDGTWEPMLLGIYDTDSGLGQDNQAVQSVSSDLWMSTIGNKDGDFEEQVYKNDGNTVVVATSNKLFLCDSRDTIYQTINGGNENGSIYTTEWINMINWLIDSGKITSVDELADYYVDNYFLPQTKGCGELLFNLTYISKYVNKYDSGSGNKTNQLNKLHGRRKYQVRSWLKKHITFLNSLFTSFGSSENVVAKEQIPNVAINACVGPSVDVTTNNSVIMSYSNQGQGGYVYCKENVPQSVFFGAPSLEISDASKSHILGNSENIIKLDAPNTNGDYDNHPLYNIGFQTINNGSLPYLTEFNTSVSTRSASNNNKLGQMTSDFMKERFTRSIKDGKRLSELRIIDFRNTYPVGNNSYVVDIEQGFEKLQELYLNDSCITNVSFPSGVSLKEINIEGSALTTLVLNEQNFIESLDLTGCKNLSSVNISNCGKLKSLKFDSTNLSLDNVTITNCAEFESFECIDNNVVKTVSIQECSSLKSVKITNCNKLELIRVYVDKLQTLNLENCSLLKTIDFLGSEIDSTDYMNTTLSLLNLNQTSVFNTKFKGVDSGLLDLSKFDPNTLTKFTTYNNTAVTHIRFSNIFDKPFNLKNQFYGCTNLERVYGHIKLYYSSYSSKIGLFSSCTKFTIHGPIATNENSTSGYGEWTPLIWKGEYILKTESETNQLYGYNSSDEWDVKDNESKIYFHTVKTPYEILGKTDVTLDDLFVQDSCATNISLDEKTDNCLVSTFRGTSTTVFDEYYLCAIIAASKRTSGIQLNETCYESNSESKFGWRLNNNPNRNMFVGCSKISNFILSFDSELTYLYSPTINNGIVTTDNGLFSPLTEMTYYYNGFTDSNNCFSRFVLRRSEGNYKLTQIRGLGNEEIYDVENSSELSNLELYKTYLSNNSNLNLSFIKTTGIYTDFFKNLPNLSEIDSSFCSKTIQYNTIQLGYLVKKIHSCFNASIGITGWSGETIEFYNLFDFSNSISSLLTELWNSFNVPSNNYGYYPKLILTNNSFYSNNKHEFKQLSEFGHHDNEWEGGIYTTGSFNNWIKQIGSEENPEFPTGIFNQLPKLTIMSNLFKNSTLYKETEDPIPLPGNLFANNSLLKQIPCMFKNLQFKHKLSDPAEYANFKNCSNLSDVRELFYYDNSYENYSKLEGSIPYQFFFHGETVGNVTKYVVNWSPTTIEKTIQVQATTEDGKLLYYVDEEASNNKDMEKTTIEITDYPVMESKKITVEIDDPNDDPNIQDEVMTKTIVGCKTPYATISQMDRCFYGCLGLESFKSDLDYSIYGEPNKDYIENVENYNYIWNGSKYVLIDKDNNLLKKPYLGYWLYNGDYDKLTQEILNNYYFEEEKVIQITNVYDNDYYGSKSEELNYMCPPDLLRYCTSNCSISGLFEYCGYNFGKTSYGGFVPESDGNILFRNGINGRIVPYLLKPVPNVTDISNLFKYCRNLSSYKSDSEVIYQIPEKFFEYAPKITKLSCAFQGLVFPENINLNVFTYLKSPSGLDIRGVLSTCLYGGENTSISGIFISNKIFKCSGAFSSREITIDDSAQGFVNIAGDNDGNGHQISINENKVKFENNFSEKNLLELNPHYVYNRYGRDVAKEEVTKINSIEDNFTF